jgi:hypothetical protein
MAAVATVRATIELEGLRKTLNFPIEFTTTTTPTTYFMGRQIQATEDTEEALNIGDVTTPLLIALVCVANDVAIDTSFSSTFSEEITVNEGEAAIFMPKGTVYLKNNNSEELSTVEYVVIGT